MPELQDDLRARRDIIRFGDLVRAVAVALPAVASILPVLPRVDSHVVRHHEDGVEANAKLADHIRRGRNLLPLELLQEALGAGACNGAEVFDQVLLRHADACILDRQRVRVLVSGDLDGHLGRVCCLAPVE